MVEGQSVLLCAHWVVLIQWLSEHSHFLDNLLEQLQSGWETHLRAFLQYVCSKESQKLFMEEDVLHS